MIGTSQNVFIHQTVLLSLDAGYDTSNHDPLCVSVKEKVNSGKKLHNKSPLGIL